MTEKYEVIGSLAGGAAEGADDHDNIDDLRAAYIGACTRAAYFYETLQDVRADLEAALQRNRDKDDELRRRGRQLDAWQDATGARTADDADDLRRAVDEREAFLDALGLDVCASAEEVVDEIENLVDANQKPSDAPVDPRPLKAGQKVRILGGRAMLEREVGDVVEALGDTDADGDTIVSKPADSKYPKVKELLWSTTECELIEDVRDIEVGSEVRVVKDLDYGHPKISEGARGQVLEPLDRDGDYFLLFDGGGKWFVKAENLELVE